MYVLTITSAGMVLTHPEESIPNIQVSATEVYYYDRISGNAHNRKGVTFSFAIEKVIGHSDNAVNQYHYLYNKAC